MERWWWRVGLALVAVSVLALATLPTRPAWLLISGSATLGALVGPAVLRPQSRRPWWRLSAGLGCFFVASAFDLVANTYDRGGAVLIVSSLLYLTGYLVVGLACLKLVHTRLPSGDPEGRIDGWIVTIAVATVLIDSTLTDAGTDASTQFAFATYLLIPLVIGTTVANAIRVMFTGAHRLPAAWFLVLAAISGFVASAAYAITGAESTWLTNTAWLVAYVSAAVGAMHPSIRELSRPAEDSGGSNVAFGRLVIIGLALAAVPATMLRQPGTMTTRIPVIAALLCVALVLWRMTRLLREREAVSDLLRHRALHDALTGLPNRAAITAGLEEAVERATLDGDPLAVLFLDLDGFKAVNDTLGHGAGDQLLAEVADRLRRSVRPGDVIGRLAGDEFVVICERAPADVAEVAQRLLETVAAPFPLTAGDAEIGVSIGIATAHAGDTPDSLLQRADTAMYQAKREGKGRLVVCSTTATVGA